MNRTDILQELDREITIRRKVWRGYNAESGHVFYDTKHQKQYRQNWTNSSTNAKKELRNYKWKVDSKTGKTLNVPVDAYNHCLDGKRYWAMMNLKTEGRRGVKIHDFSQYRR